MNENPDNEQNKVQNISVIEPEYSNILPLWKFIVLCIISFNTYIYYWFYRNWHQFKEYKNLDISPGWRTAGLFIPIYTYFLQYQQLTDIEHFAGEEKIDENFSSGWIIGSLVALSFLSLFHTYFWPINFLPLLIVQDTLNRYWKKVRPDLPTRSGFIRDELVFLMIGGLIWAFLLVSFFAYVVRELTGTRI